MRFAVHTTYYTERKAELIRACLIPAARAIGDLPHVDNVFLQRHWKLGPHVRICVRTTDAAAPDRCRDVARQLIEPFLREHPSTTPLDPIKYLELSLTLGNRELIPPPYEPLRPDNTVVVDEYDTREVLLGSQEALRFKEDFFAKALGPIEALLEATRTGEPVRFAYVLRCLAILAAMYPDGALASGYLSLRSHVEDFLHDYDKAGKLRAVFMDRYRAMAADLAAIIEQTVRDVQGQRYVGTDPMLRQWGSLFEYGWSQALPLAEAHVLTDQSVNHVAEAQQFDEAIRQKWEGANDREWSPFHTALRKLNFLPQRVGVVPFSAYRTLVNFMYAIVPLLDVSPLERYCISFAIAEATEVHFGVTWRERFEQVQERWRHARAV